MEPPTQTTKPLKNLAWEDRPKDCNDVVLRYSANPINWRD